MKLTKVVQTWLTHTTKPFTFLSDNDHLLAYQQIDQLGLYIHIPFCRSICSFCPYCKTVYQEQQVSQYIEALMKEIHMVGNMAHGKKAVTSLYFGGGSPCLCLPYLKQVLDAVAEHYIITEGIGIELHPDDVSFDTLTQLKAMGFTKISVGMQTFNEECLQSLGRKPYDYERILSILDTVDFETISVDFIFAIQNQTFESIKYDLDTAFSHNINHVAFYPLIAFSFYPTEGMMREQEKRHLLNQLLEYCEKQGYTRTSIWTFSKDKQQYSSMTRENFLGFGCSATTLLEKQFKINTFDVSSYISKIQSGSLSTALTCRFTKRQRMVYYLFWNAYSTAINPEDFKRMFQSPLSHHFYFEITLARVLGFLKKVEHTYYLTNRGTYYYHYFEGYYTLAYIDKMWSILRKEPFPSKLEL